MVFSVYGDIYLPLLSIVNLGGYIATMFVDDSKSGLVMKKKKVKTNRRPVSVPVSPHPGLKGKGGEQQKM